MSLALAAAVSLPAVAQTTTPITQTVSNRAAEPQEEDFQRMMRNTYNVEMRAVSARALGLTSEEIEGFTPVFMKYMKSKDDLTERRLSLVEDYRDEMAEDDTQKDEINETGDFIENYLEIDIAEMELKKDYFDFLEDEIGPIKALRFFELEDQFQNRVKRSMIMDMLPTMTILMPNYTTSYDREMNDYRNWNKINITGKVDVDHNFTYNGLEQLLTAAEAMTNSEGIDVNDFDGRKNMVMMKAAQMKENWKSLKHADLAREAFTATAGVLKDIATDSRFIVRNEWISKLEMQAAAIKPSVKLTDQATEVRTFFQTAETIVNDLVDQANK